MKARRHLGPGLLALALSMASGAPNALAQSDPRWNALYDRIIRLEHEMKRMKRDYEARIRRLEAALRKARNGRAAVNGRGAAQPAPPRGRAASPLTTRTAEPQVRLQPLPPLRAPQVSVEIEDPGAAGGARPEVEVLGRIRDEGVAVTTPPPAMRPPPGGSSAPRTAGPIPLPGTITDALGGAAETGGGLAPGRVAVSPLPPLGAGGGGSATPGTGGGAAAPQTAPMPQPVNIPPALARMPAGKLLQQARQSFLARRYDQAEQAYRAYLARFANNPQAVDARFELGETLYIRGRFKEAGRLFVDVYKAAPESRLAPRALLRLGQALKRMGRKKEACKAWETLVQRHPESRAATLQAPREMKRLKCRKS